MSNSINNLREEKSPYLLQHATNPVEWYPWGEKAFDKARKENKPIFLSIGYSTCHWCHVMAHESFEDPEVASLMNDVFVCVKVDREERPDIDRLYMTFCTMLTGSGGWPLTIIMTPDLKPFFAGTYLPKKTMPGRIGMLDLPGRIQQIWSEKQQDVVEAADDILAALNRTSNQEKEEEIQIEELFTNTLDTLSKQFDEKYGGFATAPKFPVPHTLLFLLRHWHRTGSLRVLKMAKKTLTAMRLGGLFDQLGFGFHRYSTDQRWLLPHFEKMLYDQAMLAHVYIEAFQATGKPLYHDTVVEIFSYVKRVLTHESGGFFSAEDADSEGVEGKFYVWTAKELGEVLNPDDAAFIMRVYNVTAQGNFVDEVSTHPTGVNILYPEKTLADISTDLGTAPSNLQERLENIRQHLFRIRENRMHPHKDDKILTDWNGLMIAALAKGARIIENDWYLTAAKKAAAFIDGNMRTQTGQLLHRYRDGEAAIPGMLDDYSFYILGLLELYEATFISFYLQEALNLTDIMIRQFWNETQGGFFQTSADGEQLLVRHIEFYDGAVPSGNSVALSNLTRLARLTGSTRLEEKAKQLLHAVSKEAVDSPTAFTGFLTAAKSFLDPAKVIVIVGNPTRGDTKAMLEALNKIYEPDIIKLFKNVNEENGLTHLAPFTKDFISLDDHATAYVCSDFHCNLPLTDINKALLLLRGK